MSGPVKPASLVKEYEKNPDITPDDIKKFKDWLSTQPHLPGELLSDVDLLIVYHCCERSIEVSKQVLDLHYTLRTLFTLFFKDRYLDKKVEFCLDTILFGALPTPTVKGYKSIYLRLLDADPQNFNLNDAIKTLMMVFDLWQYEEGTWPGFVIIIDMDQTTMGHIAKLEINTIRKTLYFLQECMLIKLKGVHFLNAPYFMDKLMMLLRPFLKKELMEMLYIHQVGADTIYQYVPKEAFPKDEGGGYKDHNAIRDETIQRLKANPQYFASENRRRVNETLRPGGKNTAVENLFGIQGSFKKLDID